MDVGNNVVKKVEDAHIATIMDVKVIVVVTTLQTIEIVQIQL